LFGATNLHRAHVEAAQEESNRDDQVEGRLEEIRRSPALYKEAYH
jgi:hypothetical protein